MCVISILLNINRSFNFNYFLIFHFSPKGWSSTLQLHCKDSLFEKFNRDQFSHVEQDYVKAAIASQLQLRHVNSARVEASVQKPCQLLNDLMTLHTLYALTDND